MQNRSLQLLRFGLFNSSKIGLSRHVGRCGFQRGFSNSVFGISSVTPKIETKSHHVLRLEQFNTFSRRFCSDKTNTAIEAVPQEGSNKTTETTQEGSELTRGHLLFSFICKVCNTRLSKTVSKLSYYKGVVIIRCDSCKNNHLIADNLGWFGEDKNIEEILRHKGEEVTKLSGDSVEYVLKEAIGQTQKE